MTKKELVLQVSKDTGLSEDDVYAVIQRALDIIGEALARGESVEFRNFGVFRIRWHRPKQGRNPHKPEDVVMIPQRPVIKFKPGRRLREALYRYFGLKVDNNEQMD